MNLVCNELDGVEVDGRQVHIIWVGKHYVVNFETCLRGYCVKYNIISLG